MEEAFSEAGRTLYTDLDVGRLHHQTVALLALCLLALACGSDPAEGPPRSAPDAPTDRPAAESTVPDAPDGSAGTTMLARDLFFPTLIPRSTALPDALGGGTLIVDGRGCLRVRSLENSGTPLWPPGFELRTGKGGIKVVDARGRLRAKVGERVVLGGGYMKAIRPEEFDDSLEEKVAQELLERCPGWYFLTQEDGTKIVR